MRATGNNIFINGIILIFKTRSCIQRDISFREMFIITEGVTGKEVLIKLNGIKSRISEEGFRIN